MNTSSLELLLVLIALSCCVATFILAEDDAVISIHPHDVRGVWEGFGTSLCWLGAAIGNTRNTDLVADLLFTLSKSIHVPDLGETAHLPGLGLNLARYNIGGSGSGTNTLMAIGWTSLRIRVHRHLTGNWMKTQHDFAVSINLSSFPMLQCGG